ncbi:ShlB/FhaC/HecB family hemolysin secretion/activation protein [Nodosilinea sp. LEGE 06152]|uniref:ShlB/FhaC/HecB family hemolysin secretion/activation protein n=1 Tax=Nodosilinea sp. LEGE 06152 TaxID=2777966 RepID=UPI001882F631|nr:ShlB/FhaC/HecB family hemolysin secretion/activation protein [Nodosilinea sp. LEGE 06152]MBE9158218.1 ShlB/FhaC/HecB family hemolysin secretion/activation protein [Nodosilinea sp. LEGE 06152]MBE9160630.1 ShlB/FhaC/HecB family hemolysin secretion/activation protein [Nodosilinea sp. LEGE 06152]
MAQWVSQVNPGQERLPEPGLPVEPLPEATPEELEPIAPPETPVLPEGEAPSLEQIQVREIVVTGSTVFSAEALDQVVQAYENRPLSVADLQSAADAVTQLYLSEGYITSQAVLQEQTIEAGIVEIQVIEGGLEAIQVEGTNQLADYVRSRIGLGAQTPLNQLQLEEQLRLLATDPLFETVRGSLQPGTVPGQTLLIVTVEEADRFSGNIGVDTLSPRSVGEYRTGATLQYLNLAGLGDRLIASAYRSTSGGSQVYDLSYQVPISPTNGTVTLRVAPNNFRITDPQEPGFALGINGSTNIYEVSVRQPLMRSLREEFALSLGYRYRDGSTVVLGTVTPATRSSVFTFGQDYTRRDPTGAWGLRSQFDIGTASGETSGQATREDETFFSWLGQAQRVQVLGPDHLLIATADLQLTPDRLFTSEQFFVGGGQSVRGYYQNARYGDNGLRFSIEDRITLVREEEDGSPIAQVIPFFDVGYVWNNSPVPAQAFYQNLIAGTGVGFLLNPAPGLTARMDLGVPLVRLNEVPGDRPSGLKVHFDVRYEF